MKTLKDKSDTPSLRNKPYPKHLKKCQWRHSHFLPVVPENEMLEDNISMRQCLEDEEVELNPRNVDQVFAEEEEGLKTGRWTDPWHKRKESLRRTVKDPLTQ